MPRTLIPATGEAVRPICSAVAAGGSPPSRSWHCGGSLHARFDGPGGASLQRLGRKVAKMEHRHWSFEVNELIALQLFASALED
jgi:hypothetical protein